MVPTNGYVARITGKAASMMPTPDSTLHVTFHPHLAASPMALPQGTLVLANSCVTSEKAVQASTRYNLHVVEATRILSRHLGMNVHSRDRIALHEVVSLLHS